MEGLSAGYGDVRVLHDVTWAVWPREFVAVIGPNGAGKSTLLRALYGLAAVQAGRVLLDGADLTPLSPAQRLARGVVYVPQGRGFFPLMSVVENLEVAAFTRPGGRALREEVQALLAEFEVLWRRRHQLAGNLSGGEQRLLELAMALLHRPRLLMLDEPSMGLAPAMMETVFERIAAIHRAGTAVVMVEQNVLGALRLAQRGLVLDLGRVRFDGPAAEILDSETLQRLYLGPPARRDV